MQYVELLRARRALRWFVGFYAILIALATYARLFGQVHTGGHHHDVEQVRDVIALCAFMAWIAATCMATGLLHESSTLAFTWTRPLRRTEIAARYFVVDLTTIVVVSLLALGTIYACAGVLGVADLLVFDLRTLVTLVLGITTALMWYALIVLAGSRLPGRAGLVAGLSWAVFMVLGSLAASPLPQPFHGIFVAVNYLNPMVWYGGSHDTVNVAVSSGQHVTAHKFPIPLGAGGRVVCTLAFSALALPAGIRLWATRET